MRPSGRRARCAVWRPHPPLTRRAARRAQVLTRLRGDAPLSLTSADQLQSYLEDTCDGLLTKLYAEWYDEAGKLKPPYAPARASKKKKS